MHDAYDIDVYSGLWVVQMVAFLSGREAHLDTRAPGPQQGTIPLFLSVNVDHPQRLDGYNVKLRCCCDGQVDLDGPQLFLFSFLAGPPGFCRVCVVSSQVSTFHEVSIFQTVST